MMKPIPKSLIQDVLDLRDGVVVDLPGYSEGSREPRTFQKGEEFLEFIQQKMGEKAIGGIEFNTSIPYDGNLVSLAGPNGGALTGGAIQHVGISSERKYEFKDLRIKNFQIAGYSASVTLENCRIGRVVLIGNLQVKLNLVNCDVGILRIDPGGCRSLKIRGGHVLDMDLPPADGENPFVGDVKISDVTFPTRPYAAQLMTGQVYRNMQAHLADLKNFPLRDQFHALEMELDRRSNPWSFNSFVSFAYDVFARYGLSASRPLLWLLGLTAVSSFLFGWFGLGVCELGEKYGWRQHLTDGSWQCGVLLGTTPLTNPLGLFSKEPIAVATTWYWAAWLTFQGLLSAVLIALSLLAIRRKFRTQE